jgi:hypothetical protein
MTVRVRPAVGLLTVLATVAAFTVFSVGPAIAGDEDEHDLTASLVEIIVEDRFQVDDLNDAGVDLAEYLRENDDGTITLNAFLTQAEMAALVEQGYTIGATIEDVNTWRAALAEWEATLAAEQYAQDLAEGVGAAAHPDEGSSGLSFSLMADPETLPPEPVTIGRTDYFVNYAGRFLSVEARRAGTGTGTNPTVAVSWRTEDGDYGSATNMSIFTDASTYMYHRILIRVGAAGSTTPVPAYVRVATSTGAVAERAVNDFPTNELPPFPDGMLTGFFNSYMDPSAVTQRFEDLAAEFPNISELIDLPHKTTGFGWPTAIMQGTTAIASAPSAANQANAVVLYAKIPAPEGEFIRAQFANPGAEDSPLSVSVVPNSVGTGGSDIIVSLATDSSGALSSTAAQVAAAINASPDAGALVNATTYPGNAGAGVVPVRALVALSDGYSPPAHFRLGQFQKKMLRISTRPAAGEPDERGERVGVYLFCQQHAREWVTPITCLETAERLVRNYGTDPLTTELVDNLDIIILPSYNPDGSHLSMLNVMGGSGASNNKRTSMTNYCTGTAAAPTTAQKNAWGVDLNRNNNAGWGGFGYAGTSTSCTGETYRGPAFYSENETKNDLWIRETFPNIKFSNNIHTFGGYFMWAPGAYTTAGRVTLPAPNIGIEGYFFQAADTILARIKEYRGTVVLPQRTGPVADVLYSAGGNSADDHWYNSGIIAYSFEAGSDRFTSTTTGTTQSSVGFQPTFATEGQHEAMEFANGNYGLLEAALAYSRDTGAPEATMAPNGGVSQTPITSTFEWVNEPSVIHYTFDGSTPTTSSPKWNAESPRQPGQRFRFNETTTVKWIAVDIKGNTSEVQSALFTIDAVAPTIDLVEPTNGQYLLGSEHEVEFSCDDNEAGVVLCEGTQESGDALDTSTPGYHTFTVNAEDAAGNTAQVSVTYQVVFDWDGFLSTFDNPPALNTAHSNGIQTFWFRLGGDQGLGVLVSAESRQIDCATLEPIGPYQPAATPNWDTFGYQAHTNRYYFPWRTTKALAGQCRELSLTFTDGTTRSAYLHFIK